MLPRSLNIRFAGLVLTAAVAFATVPIGASAQDTTSATYRVLIDGVAIGTATAAANLTSDRVVLHQNADPTLPSRQVASGSQSSVILTTADPVLIAAIQSWMKADNSGLKDTVQRKTVEIDRIVDSNTAARYRLTDAWPSRIDGASGASAITIVYQQLAPIP
jgi:hypothetical protein